MLGWLTGAALLGGAGAYSYAAIAPQSQLFGASFARGADPRQLALTYDDGPNDSCTQSLLDVLSKYGVKATFFLIGRHVRSRPDIARQIAEAGHAIGNHTYSHPNLIFTSLRKLRRELEICERVLTESIGEHARLFRPPFGAKRPAVMRTIHSMGFKPIKWSVTCYDWKPTTADRVEQHAVRQIRGGDLILMHDGDHNHMGADRSHTVEATDRLIRRYHDQGYEFVTIPEMMKGKEEQDRDKDAAPNVAT
ncbi:MAG TPA: polysaccharide deacetylase family protein [Terriglobales bacterium]|jgi:peptidoglycan/xylan/chitin deacetylase (PgdA/CDA1 family)|nr:polysaccharide deacetylase family protein [Terriglobales bacterium]